MSFDNSYKNYKVDSIYLKDICIGKADDSVEKILLMWQKTEKRVYVVTDENGKAEGIITLYDVLEEIVPTF